MLECIFRTCNVLERHIHVWLQGYAKSMYVYNNFGIKNINTMEKSLFKKQDHRKFMNIILTQFPNRGSS